MLIAQGLFDTVRNTMESTLPPCVRQPYSYAANATLPRLDLGRRTLTPRLSTSKSSTYLVKWVEDDKDQHTNTPP